MLLKEEGMKKYENPVATTIQFLKTDAICSSSTRSLEDLYTDPNNAPMGDSVIDKVEW